MCLHEQGKHCLSPGKWEKPVCTLSCTFFSSYPSFFPSPLSLQLSFLQLQVEDSQSLPALPSSLGRNHWWKSPGLKLERKGNPEANHKVLPVSPRDWLTPRLYHGVRRAWSPGPGLASPCLDFEQLPHLFLCVCEIEIIEWESELIPGKCWNRVCHMGRTQ